MKKHEIYLNCVMYFNAAHRLHNPAFSKQENLRIYGPCNNEYGHGHNYKIEVIVKGSVDPDTGMVINLVELKDIVHKLIIKECDHKHLNFDVPWLKGINPTAENLAIVFWQRLEKKIKGVKLYKLRLLETDTNIVEYMGE